MTGFAGALLGGLGNLLGFFSGERRHNESIEQAAQHHQENRVSDAVARFAEHLLTTGFNAPVNRRFLDSLTDGLAAADKVKVAREGCYQAPNVVSWLKDEGGVERFLELMELHGED